MTTILGVDPGTNITGYGVVERSNGSIGILKECGVIRTNPKDELAGRLRCIYEGINELIDRFHPDALAVEGIFYAKNVRTTVLLGHARGAILLAAAGAGIRVAELPPATVKKAIAGGGGANKAQVGHMVQQILRLKTAPTPNDAADGVALALTYLMTHHDR